MRHLAKLAAVLVGVSIAASASAAPYDWSKVDEIIGKKGTMQPGDVHKIGLPRTDLHVTVGDIKLKPALALGSHLEFKMMGQGAILMGDLVLTAEEIQPVMARLARGGIDVTALHNHLIGTTPDIYYMHVSGYGDPIKLAAALHTAILASKTPLNNAASASSQGSLGIDIATIDAALGAKGTASGGVYQISIPRAETIKEGGMAIPPPMGTAIAINFQPTGGGKAAITGDFVLIAKEVNPVLRTLREHGIAVTALHNHMLDDAPRLFYLHFWANDDAVKLAQGLRAALDHVNIKHN